MTTYDLVDAAEVVHGGEAGRLVNDDGGCLVNLFVRVRHVIEQRRRDAREVTGTRSPRADGLIPRALFR